MFKILMSDVGKITNEYSALDKKLAGIVERLTTASSQCMKQGYETSYKQLRKVADDILENRRNLYECSDGLRRITKIYKKSEERVFEEIDGVYKKESREIKWISFHFSKDMLELINKIEF